MASTNKPTPMAQVVSLRAAKEKKHAAEKAAAAGSRRKERPARPLPPVPAEEAEAALLEMARQLARHSGPTEALRAQLQVVHVLLKSKACYVARHDPGRPQLHIEHVRGRYDARITAVSPEEGAVGRAFSARTVVRQGDTLAVPLEGPQGLSGCLAILAPKRGASDTLLLALGGQLAAAYEVARLRDDSARRNKDLQTAIAGLKSLEENRDELLSNVSHDLKNPLATLKAYLAQLARQKLGPVSDAQRRALQTCDRSADRMLRMVNDLLLMSRLQTGKMQLDQRPFGLKALAEEVVRSLSPLAEVCQVELRVPPCAEAFVRGDRERLGEAIHNLVEAGIHRCQVGCRVEVSVASEDGLARLGVRDSGPALGAEELEHVFDPFFRARPGMPRPSSAGLGLPLVAKIATLHGGRAEAASSEGDGSSFQLVLPMFAGALSTPDAHPAAPRAGGILLVEDDRDCREVLQEVLEEEGYRVMTAATASEARSILSNIRPALVLLDLRLNEEDGRSVLRFVRAEESLRDVAVYIISGASEVASLAQGQGLERIDGFFEKPLPLPKLLDTVAAVVRPSRRTAG